MSRFLKLSFTLAALAACREGPKDVPQSKDGSRTLAQVYVLSAKASPLAAYWAFPSAEELRGSLGAHVEQAEVADTAAAVETLKKWNARPVDLLILGPGIATDAWQSLKLPKVAGRRVLLIGTARGRADENETGVEVPWNDVEGFLQKFCRDKKLSPAGCRVLPESFGARLSDAPALRTGKRIVWIGEERENLAAGGVPVSVSVHVKWKEWLASVLALREKAERRENLRADTQKLGFFSGYLEVSRGPGLQGAETVKSFTKLKEGLMLDRLRSEGP